MKILTFDLETCGISGFKSDWGFVMIFGWKWAHEKRAHTLMIDRRSLSKFSDYKLLLEASKIFAEADLVVGHFASVFDRRFLQGRLLINGLPPIPPTKMRDTCMIARSCANFSSNSLKNLSKVLYLHSKKTEHDYPEDWISVMKGDLKALRKLARYCESDVLATEELYFKLRPYDNAHPRIVVDRAKCPVCGGVVQYRGVAYVSSRRYRRYQCTKCTRWGRETTSIKEAN